MARNDIADLMREVAELKAMLREVLGRLPAADVPVRGNPDLRAAVEAEFSGHEVSAADVRHRLAMDDVTTMEVGRRLTAAGFPKRRKSDGVRYRIGVPAGEPARLGRPVEMPADIEMTMQRVRGQWEQLGLMGKRLAPAYGVLRENYPDRRPTPAQCAELARMYPDVVRA